MENSEVKEYIAEWAGYNDQGNDRTGHLHIHPDGNFIRHDLVKGFYCHAPIELVSRREFGKGPIYVCFDPPPQFLEAIKETK